MRDLMMGHHLPWIVRCISCIHLHFRSTGHRQVKQNIQETGGKMFRGLLTACIILLAQRSRFVSAEGNLNPELSGHLLAPFIGQVSVALQSFQTQSISFSVPAWQLSGSFVHCRLPHWAWQTCRSLTAPWKISARHHYTKYCRFAFSCSKCLLSSWECGSRHLQIRAFVNTYGFYLGWFAKDWSTQAGFEHIFTQESCYLFFTGWCCIPHWSRVQDPGLQGGCLQESIMRWLAGQHPTLPLFHRGTEVSSFMSEHRGKSL